MSNLAAIEGREPLSLISSAVVSLPDCYVNISCGNQLENLLGKFSFDSVSFLFNFYPKQIGWLLDGLDRTSPVEDGCQSIIRLEEATEGKKM